MSSNIVIVLDYMQIKDLMSVTKGRYSRMVWNVEDTRKNLIFYILLATFFVISSIVCCTIALYCSLSQRKSCLNILICSFKCIASDTPSIEDQCCTVRVYLLRTIRVAPHSGPFIQKGADPYSGNAPFCVG